MSYRAINSSNDVTIVAVCHWSSWMLLWLEGCGRAAGAWVGKQVGGGAATTPKICQNTDPNSITHRDEHVRGSRFDNNTGCSF